MGHGVDLLIIAALPEEYDAALAAAEPDRRRPDAHGGAGRPVRMGARGVGPLTTTLTDALKPRCLAMCGVCAGNPAATAPGDVVVATAVYEWDEGKHTGAGFLASPQQYPLNSRWIRAAQDLDPAGLPGHGSISDEDAATWFLERLYRGENPRTQAATERYFTPATWKAGMERHMDAGLVAWRGDGLALTAAGRDHIQRLRYADIGAPDRLPFLIHTGAMASGSAVMADSTVWDRLVPGQRDVLAVDMEAATVATVAFERDVPHWLVAKGVSDHADPRKDDRFKAFAARSSAAALFARAGQLLPGESPEPPRAAVPAAVQSEITRQLAYDWPDLADLLGVPTADARRFRAGDEPRELWDWLAAQGRLAELGGALTAIGRPGLTAMLSRYV